jgi:formylglycine-generating enzyme
MARANLPTMPANQQFWAAATTGLAVAILSATAACSREKSAEPTHDAAAEPDVAAALPGVSSAAGSASASAPQRQGHCPPDMVKVADRYCVDRYELVAVDDQERQASPYFPLLQQNYRTWIDARRAEAAKLQEADGGAQGASAVTPFPSLPDWQKKGAGSLKALSKAGVLPNAYLSMYTSRDVCVRSEKRLCSLEEWQTACRGENATRFPYGDDYRVGVCNVFREEHPGHVLFGQFTVGMLDPRMNLVTSRGRPLLRKTGETPACKSVWGQDAIYDMVGNLDEWVDDAKGKFAGGFYSRNTKKGCDQLIEGHPAGYTDYSTGGRCCRDRIANDAPGG